MHLACSVQVLQSAFLILLQEVYSFVLAWLDGVAVAVEDVAGVLVVVGAGWKTAYASLEGKDPGFVEPLPQLEDALNMLLVAFLGVELTSALASWTSVVVHQQWQQDTSSSSEAGLGTGHTQQVFQGSDCPV